MNEILIFSANPADTTQLKLDEEVREIQSKIEGTTLSENIKIETRWATRVDDLFQVFGRIKPIVVHFSGHGSKEGNIILLDQDGKAKPISINALARFFQIIDDSIKIVVLNACYSEEQASEISKHVDCVIGMTRAISDDGAISFSASFYRALGFGNSCRAAFDQACLSLEFENLGEEETPKIMLKDNIDASTIFLKKK